MFINAKYSFLRTLDLLNHSARKISYEDALIFEQIHVDVYKEFGFKIVLVPKKTITERCKFVLEMLGIKK